MAASNNPVWFEVVRLRIHLKHYSHQADEPYVHWIRRFVPEGVLQPGAMKGSFGSKPLIHGSVESLQSRKK